MFIFLVFGVGLAAAAQAAGVHTYQLSSEANATVNKDGSLVVAQGGRWLVTGLVEVASAGRRVRDRINPPFTMVVAEGAIGGQRGFSANRDDDGDGVVDEDPLDGRDNDGDGRVDEDFAAISDAMVVFDRSGFRSGVSTAHLEYYHWSYPWLRSTVFLSVSGSVGDTYRLKLPERQWYPATLESPRHSLAGKGDRNRVEAYVGQPRHGGDCRSTAVPWVGVVVRTSGYGQEPALDGATMAVPLDEEPRALAVCVAETWLQLSFMMNEAMLAQNGAEDKMTGRRAPMIVAPQCAQCRLAPDADFTLGRTPRGQLMLSADIAAGRAMSFDPDQFRLAGLRLGAPSAIQWLPDDGVALFMPWDCLGVEGLNSAADEGADAYLRMLESVTHQSTGQLRFLFDSDAGLPGGPIRGLSGSYLDGRTFEVELLRIFGDDPNDVSLEDDPSGSRKKEPRISLSPKLLEGFPNPFRDQIQLRFEVPATVGEAFVWDDDLEPPEGMSPMAALPWQNGTPTVSVRIYSLNGQELVTLFAASQGPGTNMVHWDGSDQFGRKAASGTYFCKLQIDKWSVTKRLVFLR